MKKLKIYYSGEGGYEADPEYVLQERCNVMLTFHPMRVKGPTRRFKWILRSRRKRDKK